MLKVEHLQQFLAVCQYQNLAQAAKSLHRTPSAVSMTLKHLEMHLDGALFEGERKQQLTPLGAYVCERAARSVKEHLSCLDDIERFARGESGLVRIAAVPSATAQHLPRVIAHSCTNWPEIHIELRDTDSQAVQTEILSGNADLGVASLIEPNPRLSWQLLRTDAFVCVCAQGHPLSKKTKPLCWADLQPHTFIDNGLCQHIHHDTVRQLSNNAQLKVHNTISLLALVRNNLGITLLPAGSVTDTHGLHILSMQDQQARRSLYLLTQEGLSASPATQMIASQITAEFKRHT